jgi:hypothetical protein
MLEASCGERVWMKKEGVKKYKAGRCSREPEPHVMMMMMVLGVV